MDPIYYYKELIAVISGMLIVLLPLAFRFLFYRSRSRRPAAPSAPARPAKLEAAGSQASPPEPWPPIDRAPVPTVVDERFIRRIRGEEAEAKSMPEQRSLTGMLVFERPSDLMNRNDGDTLVPEGELAAGNYRDWAPPKKSFRGWNRVGRLTPLKRAVLLAEILGPPLGARAFQDILQRSVDDAEREES